MTRQIDVKAIVSHIIRGDGADKCRICMGDTNEGQVHLTDTVMLDGDRPVTLSELLENITGVEVTVEDKLPMGLCTLCYESAYEAAVFRNLCLKAASQWDSTVLLLNTIDNSSDRIKSIYCILDNGFTIVEDLKDEDKTAAETLTLLTQSKSDVAIERRQKLVYCDCQCCDCGKKFVSPYMLYVHLKEASHCMTACYVCARVMLKDDLMDHLNKLHKEIPYSCNICKSVFRSKRKYEDHVTKDHREGGFACIECGRTFSSSHSYSAHKSVHDLKTCPGCSKNFRNQKCYIYHIQICCELKKLSSDHQMLRTRRKVMEDKNDRQKLKVGLRGSTNKKCYCDYCGKKFAGKRFVAAHIQNVHTKDTHKPCVYCGKHFAAARMSNHVKSHETNVFKCEYCNFELKTKLGYTQHIRLHTGEKPYSCNQCGETFSASSRRSEHIRKTHKSSEIILKHRCVMCPARFRLPYRLKKHMASSHGLVEKDNLKECSLCGEKFSLSGLVHHKKKHQHDRDMKI